MRSGSGGSRIMGVASAASLSEEEDGGRRRRRRQWRRGKREKTPPKLEEAEEKGSLSCQESQCNHNSKEEDEGREVLLFLGCCSTNPAMQSARWSGDATADASPPSPSPMAKRRWKITDREEITSTRAEETGRRRRRYVSRAIEQCGGGERGGGGGKSWNWRRERRVRGIGKGWTSPMSIGMLLCSMMLLAATSSQTVQAQQQQQQEDAEEEQQQHAQDSRCFLDGGGSTETFFIKESLKVGSLIGTLRVIGDPGSDIELSLAVRGAAAARDRDAAVGGNTVAGGDVLLPLEIEEGTKNLRLTSPLDKEGETGPSSVGVDVLCERKGNSGGGDPV